MLPWKLSRSRPHNKTNSKEKNVARIPSLYCRINLMDPWSLFRRPSSRQLRRRRSNWIVVGMLKMSVVCWLFWWKLDLSKWNIKKVITILINSFHSSSFCSSPLTKSIIPTQHPMLELTHTLSSIYNDFFSPHHYLTIFIVYNILSCHEACGMSISMHIFWFPIFHCSLRAFGVKILKVY